MRPAPLAFGALALAALGFAELRLEPRTLLLNLSASVPIGIYRLAPAVPRRGSLVAIKLPEPVQRLAVERGYLGGRMLLLKPVAALAGERVCRLGTVVSLDGRPVVVARRVDTLGRPLPRWQGCRRLGADEILVLAAPLASFDGRYFGPMKRSNIVAEAMPILTFEHQ